VHAQEGKGRKVFSIHGVFGVFSRLLGCVFVRLPRLRLKGSSLAVVRPPAMCALWLPARCSSLRLLIVGKESVFDQRAI